MNIISKIEMNKYQNINIESSQIQTNTKKNKNDIYLSNDQKPKFEK